MIYRPATSTAFPPRVTHVSAGNRTHSRPPYVAHALALARSLPAQVDDDASRSAEAEGDDQRQYHKSGYRDRDHDDDAARLALRAHFGRMRPLVYVDPDAQ